MGNREMYSGVLKGGTLKREIYSAEVNGAGMGYMEIYSGE